MSTETPEETIARLTESNRRLANQIVGYGDRMQTTIAGIVKDAKVEALRDAADLLAPKGILWWGDSGVRVSDGPFGMPQGSLDDWLRTRADNLEAS